jgi:hypothetical protein
MATAIFIGLMCIAEAIESSNGKKAITSPWIFPIIATFALYDIGMLLK